MWAAGGGGGGGSGTVTSVAAGPYCVDSGTPTVAPVIGLNIIPLGTVGTNGQVLSATATANELAWINPLATLSANPPVSLVAGVISLPIAGTWSATNNTVQGSSATALEWGPDAAGVTSITAGANIVVAGTAPVPIISMPILNDPPTAGQIVGFSGTNTLAWVSNPTDGVAQVKPGVNTTIGGSATIPNVNVVVAGTYAATNVVGSTDGGTTMTWVANPADGVTSIGPGTNTLVAGTASVPIVNVVVAGTYAATNVVGSTDGGTTMTWVANPADGVTGITAGANVVVAGTASVPIISMPILNDPPTTGQIVGFSGTNTLAWVNNPADGVTSIGPGTNTLVAGTVSVPIVNVHVEGAYAAGYVVGSTDAGTTMTWVSQRDAVASITAGANVVVAGTASVPIISMPILNDPPSAGQIVGFSGTNTLAWVNNPADGVTSVVEGNGIDVDNATPTAPVISVAVRPNSFVANNVGTSVNQVDLNVGACPTAGYVLSSTVGGGSGSTVAPTLTWVDPLAGLSATAPVTLTAGVIALPISGSWSTTNNVVKGSSTSALVWGPDSSGTTYTGTAPIVVTGSAISVAEGLYLTTNASNQLDLNITNASTAGYYLTADPVAGQMQWQPPPAGTGTVTNVTATTGGYCTIGSTSTTTPSVGLNLVNAAASGQILAATGNLTLEFIDIPPATLPAVTQGPASFASATLYTVTPSLPVPVLVIDADIGVTTDPFLYTQFGNLCMIQPTFNYVVTITSLGTVPVGTTGYKLVLNSNAPLPSIGSITDPLALALSPATNPQTYLSGTWGSGAGGLGLTIQWTIGTGSPGAGSVYNGILPPISYATA